MPKIRNIMIPVGRTSFALGFFARQPVKCLGTARAMRKLIDKQIREHQEHVTAGCEGCAECDESGYEEGEWREWYWTYHVPACAPCRGRRARQAP